jgi:ABC-type amino acid transport system permease subunit
MMVERESETDEKIWKIFLRKHWKILVLFVAAAVLAIIGAILVFLWFVGDAQLTGLVPTTLGLWTMGYLVTFLLHLILWEVLFIGIPVIVAIAAIYLLWWKKLPDEERSEYKRKHLFGKRSHGRDQGGAITLLVNIVFIIKVYLDGNWNVPFATWTFDYLVYSYLLAFILIAIIFGIPLTIGAIWWIHREMHKKP